MMQTGKSKIWERMVATFAIWLLTIFIIGCGGSGGGGDSDTTVSQGIDLTNYEGPPVFDLALEQGTFVSETIDSNTGGQITTEGSVRLVLDIPPGALDEETTVSLSLFSSDNPDNYALAVLFEPDGLELNEAATLEIFFDPPLSPDQPLYLLEGDSDNIDDAYNTGVVVTASSDGSTVELPVEHFCTGGFATEFVCHTQTDIGMIDYLKKKGFTHQEIADGVLKTYRKEIADNLKNDPLSPQKDPAVFVKDSIESLVNNQNMQKGKSVLLMKGLLKTYYKKALSEADIDTKTNTAMPTTSKCRNQLKEITVKGDVAVALFSSTFKKDPLNGHISHSGATSINKDEQDNNKEVVVIENAAVVGDDVGNAWSEALIERKKQYPTQDEIPRVIPVPIDDIDKLRDKAPVNAINQYLRKDLNITDSNELLNGGKKPTRERKTWGSVRFYIPRDDLLTKSLNRAVMGEICPYEDPAYVDDIDHDGDYYSVNQGDCNDLYDSVHPGAEEICDDSVDNDCNDEIDCDDSACEESLICEQEPKHCSMQGTDLVHVDTNDDPSDGTYIACSYHANEQLSVETPMTDYKRDGIEKSYYDSGQLRSVLPYTDGERNGVKKWYYESGQLNYEEPYTDDKRNGVRKEYYESGQLRFEIPYADDKRNGVKKEYYESGQLDNERTYTDGVLNGMARDYDFEGTLTHCFLWVNGTRTESCL